jgi:uncharacterized BrkB/YihY/UPF0761 family membrane protein
MLFMLAISLTTIKKFQTKQQTEQPSVLKQQFIMSIMMAAAFGITYITVIVVNVHELFKTGKVVNAAQISTINAFILTMPLITASILVILRTFGVYAISSTLPKARVKDQANQKITRRRNTLDSMRPQKSVNESQDEIQTD